MTLTDTLLSDGRLNNLDIFSEWGVNRNIHYSRGRFGVQTNLHLYRRDRHPVISSKSTVAWLIIKECHEGPGYGNNHKKAMDTLGRFKHYCYIHQCFKLAKMICDDCHLCKRMEAAPCTQRMGQLPQEILSTSPPFSTVSADICGPFRVWLKKIPKIWVLVYIRAG